MRSSSSSSSSSLFFLLSLSLPILILISIIEQFASKWTVRGTICDRCFFLFLFACATTLATYDWRERLKIIVFESEMMNRFVCLFGCFRLIFAIHDMMSALHMTTFKISLIINLLCPLYVLRYYYIYWQLIDTVLDCCVKTWS